MMKQNPRKTQPVVSAAALDAQAAEALRLSRFKEAIELYKQLLKGEARQDWRDALAAAYVGRAKALSAKGLFKEAEIVLGNAVALDGAVKEPLFLLSCLVRQGQIQKALAQALKYIGSDALEPSQARLLSELTVRWSWPVRFRSRRPRATRRRASNGSPPPTRRARRCPR